MADRVPFQKTKAKFSASLLLFGNRKWNKNPNLDYPHCPIAYNGAKNKLQNKKDFSTMVALLRIHLIRNLDVFWVVEQQKNLNKTTKKNKTTKLTNRIILQSKEVGCLVLKTAHVFTRATAGLLLKF